uniref:hypothetical protein n=1 Tax=Marinobacterium profundum TaxID=1714300 RepID=UPI00082ADAD1
MIVADKGDDNGRIRVQVVARPVIPRKRHLIKNNGALERGLYYYRRLVGNAFARLKYCRAVVFRYGKLNLNYDCIIAVACGFLSLSMYNVNSP